MPLVTFLLFSALYSFVTVPYGALTANMTMDGNERSTLTGIRMSCAILGTFATAGAAKPIIALFPNEVIGFRMIWSHIRQYLRGCSPYYICNR